MGYFFEEEDGFWWEAGPQEKYGDVLDFSSWELFYVNR